VCRTFQHSQASSPSPHPTCKSLAASRQPRPCFVQPGYPDPLPPSVSLASAILRSASASRCPSSQAQGAANESGPAGAESRNSASSRAPTLPSVHHRCWLGSQESELAGPRQTARTPDSSIPGGTQGRPSWTGPAPRYPPPGPHPQASGSPAPHIAPLAARHSNCQ